MSSALFGWVAEVSESNSCTIAVLSGSTPECVTGTLVSKTVRWDNGNDETRCRRGHQRMSKLSFTIFVSRTPLPPPLKYIYLAFSYGAATSTCLVYMICSLGEIRLHRWLPRLDRLRRRVAHALAQRSLDQITGKEKLERGGARPGVPRHCGRSSLGSYVCRLVLSCSPPPLFAFGELCIGSALQRHHVRCEMARR